MDVAVNRVPLRSVTRRSSPDLREVVIAIEAGDVEEPVLTDLDRQVQRAAIGSAAGLVVLARGQIAVAALGVVLKDDVDDAAIASDPYCAAAPSFSTSMRRIDDGEIRSRSAIAAP